MIVAYLFISMIFFKVFAEFAFPHSITVIGSFMMALASSVIMFGTTLTANIRGVKWLQTGARGLPWEPVFVCIAGTTLAALSAWIVGVGFSQRFFRWANGYNGEPFWVLAMLTLPPAVHSFIVCRDIWKLGRDTPR